MITIKIIIIILMILISAFFVASEFSLIRIRSSRVIELMNSEGPEAKKAKIVFEIKEHINDYLGACQVGITITSIVIGGMGEHLFSQLFEEFFTTIHVPTVVRASLSVTIAYIFLTYVHVVFGDLLPKSVSIAKTESIALAVARPLHMFYRISKPVIWLMNSSTNLIGKIFHIPVEEEKEESMSQGELIYIAGESFKDGKINKEEHRFVEKIFDFDDTIATEVMKNRTEIFAIDDTEDIGSALKILTEVEYTRVPVVKNNNKDEILGYVRQQDLIREYLNGVNDLEVCLEEPIRALETIKIKDLFRLMRNSHKHLAILVDEHGGTSGLITIEDIIEEVFGDIQDESDSDEIEPVKINDNEFLFDGSTELEEIEELLPIKFEDNDDDDFEIETINGYLVHAHPEILSSDYDQDKYRLDDNYVAIVKELDENKSKIDSVVIKKEEHKEIK